MNYRSILIAICLICLATTGMAETEAEPDKASVSDFLTPDGRFDLEAARRAGFEGSLDLEGFDVTLDPTNGAPRLSPQATQADPDDQYWHDLSVPDVGMDGRVYSLTVYNGELIAGGYFTTAGGAAASNIARWNGSEWLPLGSGMSDPVVSLTVYNGELIAGGEFWTAGGVADTRYIARWDGVEWRPLGLGMNKMVLSLTVYGVDLIAGGNFTAAGGVTANRIARWNGPTSTWSAIGSGMDNRVYSLTVYNGELIAGGWFTSSGNYIARWTGSTWQMLPSIGLWAAGGGYVYSLTVYGNDLIAGGQFTSAGGTTVNRVARWDGSWHELGSGMNGTVRSLTVYNGDLIAGGDFTTADGFPANRIARWDSSTDTWQPLGSGMNYLPFALTVYNGELIAGGDFTTAGGVAANYIARWNGWTWQPLGASGLTGFVYSLTVYTGDLIAGGRFGTAGGVPANHIARWDGLSSTWHPLGSGMSGFFVSSLTVYLGELIAGGNFTTAGGVAAPNIARWDGSTSTWSALGLPGSGMNDPVYSLTVYNGEGIAGGAFTTAGGVAAPNIARWDGSTWRPLGPPASGMNDYVYSLTVYGDDLIAGGDFTTAGPVTANRVARWNGFTSTWSALGSGMNNRVWSLTVYNGELIAGGEFTTGGGNYIARWDVSTSTWLALGSGMDQRVLSLAVYNDELIAGGEFTTAGTVAADYIARWDGSTWQPLGSGMNNLVLSLTVYNGDQIAAGAFTTAGETAVNHIARWDKPATDTDGDGDPDWTDPDDDNDGVVDASDTDPLDPYVCQDIDADGCDDCAIGVDGFLALPDYNPLNDGIDTDIDGLCDSGDPDDDNDGVLDASDINPLNPSICEDVDADGCDDCSIGTDGFGPDPDFDPSNDGIDTDGDGLCDSGDTDDDWDISLAIDNFGTVYYGSNTGTIGPPVGDVTSWAGATNFVTTQPRYAFLYVATGSDHNIAQGFVGRFTNTGLNKTAFTGDPVWQVFPAGKYADALGNDDPWPPGTMPTQGQVNLAISFATTGNYWETPTSAPGYDLDPDTPTYDIDYDPNNPTARSYPWLYGSSYATIWTSSDRPRQAQWIWFESGLHGSGSISTPFQGGNHQEFLVFRIAGQVEVDAARCIGRVGDANGVGGDEPTIGDVSVMIDALFITGECEGILESLLEADVNQSGGLFPDCSDITIGDISTLIDYLFITGPTLGLPDCL